jgi:hypothetical protein
LQFRFSQSACEITDAAWRESELPYASGSFPERSGRFR